MAASNLPSLEQSDALPGTTIKVLVGGLIYETIAAPGTTIKVLVGGLIYETIIDKNGVQRFIEDPNHYLVERLITSAGNPNHVPAPNADVRDLNQMVMLYHAGEFSQRDYAEFNMALGYSVDGFCDLSQFFDMDIENPVGTPYRMSEPLDD